MIAITRYRLEFHSCNSCIDKHPDGEWVRWDDVKDLLPEDEEFSYVQGRPR